MGILRRHRIQPNPGLPIATPPMAQKPIHHRTFLTALWDVVAGREARNGRRAYVVDSPGELLQRAEDPGTFVLEPLSPGRVV
jgi:hypothetical protein